MSDPVLPTPTVSLSRSVSRTREVHSSGRGGIGNISRPTNDLNSNQTYTSTSSFHPNEDIVTLNREREPQVKIDRALSTGRGGQGNFQFSSLVRSVSQIDGAHPKTASLVLTSKEALARYERQLIKDSEEVARITKHSSGRGGAGNISLSSPKPKLSSHIPAGDERPKQFNLFAPFSPSRMGSIKRGRTENLAKGKDIERGDRSLPDGMRNELDMISRSPSTPPERRHGTHLRAEHSRTGSIFRSSSSTRLREVAQPHGLNKIWHHVSRSQPSASQEKQFVGGLDDSVEPDPRTSLAQEDQENGIEDDLEPTPAVEAEDTHELPMRQEEDGISIMQATKHLRRAPSSQRLIAASKPPPTIPIPPLPSSPTPSLSFSTSSASSSSITLRSHSPYSAVSFTTVSAISLDSAYDPPSPTQSFISLLSISSTDTVVTPDSPEYFRKGDSLPIPVIKVPSEEDDLAALAELR